MKIKLPRLLVLRHLVFCILITVVMAVMMAHVFPLLAKVAAPLDSIILPPSLLGLKLSSAFIGVVVCSAVSAIPAMARALEPDMKSIICHTALLAHDADDNETVL